MLEKALVERIEMARHGVDVDRTHEWDAMRGRHLKPKEQREASSARGVHHIALLSSDVERTLTVIMEEACR